MFENLVYRFFVKHGIIAGGDFPLVQSGDPSLRSGAMLA